MRDKKKANEIAKRWYHKHKDRLKADPEWVKKKRKARREYASRTKPARRAYTLKTLYGLSYKEYQEMLLKQDNRCDICQELMDKPNVDHCHLTGKVRSLLCTACNQGLGMFKDKQELLESAKNYLTRWI